METLHIIGLVVVVAALLYFFWPASSSDTDGAEKATGIASYANAIILTLYGIIVTIVLARQMRANRDLRNTRDVLSAQADRLFDKLNTYDWEERVRNTMLLQTRELVDQSAAQRAKVAQKGDKAKDYEREWFERVHKEMSDHPDFLTLHEELMKVLRDRRTYPTIQDAIDDYDAQVRAVRKIYTGEDEENEVKATRAYRMLDMLISARDRAERSITGDYPSYRHARAPE